MDLKIIQTFVYSLMMWKRKSFLKQYKKNKSGILSGKAYFYPIKDLSTIIIKNLEDIKLANFVMKSKSKKFILNYDKILRLKKLNSE